MSLSLHNSVGTFRYLMALTLLGSAFTPMASTMWTRNRSSACLYTHFFLWSLRHTCSILSNVFCRCLSWVAMSFPWTITSSISSVLGSWYLFLLRFLLSFWRATQILTAPVVYMTGTKGAHQSVGCVTFTITPCSSILCSSFWILGRSGRGTLLAVCTASGTAPSIRWILTGSVFSVSWRPATALICCTRLTSPISTAVSIPSRLLTVGYRVTFIRESCRM